MVLFVYFCLFVLPNLFIFNIRKVFQIQINVHVVNKSWLVFLPKFCSIFESIRALVAIKNPLKNSATLKEFHRYGIIIGGDLREGATLRKPPEWNAVLVQGVCSVIVP